MKNTHDGPRKNKKIIIHYCILNSNSALKYFSPKEIINNSQVKPRCNILVFQFW